MSPETLCKRHTECNEKLHHNNKGATILARLLIVALFEGWVLYTDPLNDGGRKWCIYDYIENDDMTVPFILHDIAMMVWSLNVLKFKYVVNNEGNKNV